MNSTKFVKTQDGTYTAQCEDFQNETMHHTGGAFEETLYVYGPAIKGAIQGHLTPNFLSVGLGLGYVELLIAAMYLHENEPRKKGLCEEIYIESFETNPQLVRNFLDWLADIPNSTTHIYDQVAVEIEHRLNVTSEDIKEFLLEAYEVAHWKIREELAANTVFPQKFDAILYDLYSAKVMEEFWEEDFLENFLKKASGKRSIFSTYAAKSSLKKALFSTGYEVKERPGFKGKRESTLALRRP